MHCLVSCFYSSFIGCSRLELLEGITVGFELASDLACMLVPVGAIAKSTESRVLTCVVQVDDLSQYCLQGKEKSEYAVSGALERGASSS